MERAIYQQLKTWKDSPSRKPLILEGARQVGKTYILKEFGNREYDNLVYINCDNNDKLSAIFSDYDTRIIRSISAISGESIVPGKTLIFLDEIQEINKGLASLKYFCENAPEYHVAVAGSLLGITLHEGTSFPVGKVDMLYLYPMDFEEFLLAMGREKLVEVMRSRDWDTLTPLRPLCEELLRQYYFTGGMPEAVAAYIQTQDIGRSEAFRRKSLRHIATTSQSMLHTIRCSVSIWCGNRYPHNWLATTRSWSYARSRKEQGPMSFRLPYSGS